MDEPDDEFFPEYYDLENVFDKQIQPLLKSIINICSEYNIPMVTAFQYQNDADEVMMCTSVVLPEIRTCEKLNTAAKLLMK